MRIREKEDFFMNENNANNSNSSVNAKEDLANSKTLFVLKIVTMSFAIFACLIVVTVMLTGWIIQLKQQVRESHSKIARAAARINKFRNLRIKHILKQRKMQLKEERRELRKKHQDKNKKLTDSDLEDDLLEEITDDDNAINDFDNELSDILLENLGD